MSERLSRLLGKGEGVKEKGESFPDPYLSAKCPILSAMLSVTEFEGGPRTPSTLILFCEDGRSKVLVNNKHAGTVGVLTVETFEDVFEALESALNEDKVEFRRSKGQNGYSRNRA